MVSDYLIASDIRISDDGVDDFDQNEFFSWFRFYFFGLFSFEFVGVDAKHDTFNRPAATVGFLLLPCSAKQQQWPNKNGKT